MSVQLSGSQTDMMKYGVNTIHNMGKSCSFHQKVVRWVKKGIDFREDWTMYIQGRATFPVMVEHQNYHGLVL